MTRYAVAAAIAIAASASAGVAKRPSHDATQVRTSADTLADLPLHTVAARGVPSPAMAVMLSGDGGWAAIDKEIADSLAAHGIPVAGLDSRTYFSTQRDPDGASRDLDRIITHDLAAWQRERVMLIGYSRGADVLPFMTTRLPADRLARVDLVALLGAAPNANFKFHLVDLISNKKRKDDLATVPEIAKLAGTRVLCVYGADEKESACRALDPAQATVIEMPGGHHFDKEYGVIATRILDAGATP